ncbi:MAG: DUF3375 family protein, partial [Steroidobacteraceae bacterium]
FVASLVEPRTAATESRLAAVIQQLARLADETDVDPQTRIAKLLLERDRIDREIESTRQGNVKIEAMHMRHRIQRLKDREYRERRKGSTR